jgi:hypothetical protein
MFSPVARTGRPSSPAMLVTLGFLAGGICAYGVTRVPASVQKIGSWPPDIACEQQTWPYIERRCIGEAQQERRIARVISPERLRPAETATARTPDMPPASESPAGGQGAVDASRDAESNPPALTPREPTRRKHTTPPRRAMRNVAAQDGQVIAQGPNFLVRRVYLPPAR